jgi:hypothetical protein
MDSTTWLDVGHTLCTLIRRAEAFKCVIQCTHGKTDLVYKRFTVFVYELETMRVCLGKIMDADNSGVSVDTVFYNSSDWSTEDPVQVRPLPKQFTEPQRLVFQVLLADVSTYLNGLDAYPFGYHAQLRVYRNTVLRKLNILL